jgi:hypothetical protein
MSASGHRRVVITGLGAVTPLGNNVRSSWDQLMAGKGAAGPITAFDTTGYAVTFACDAKDFEATQWIQRKQARRMDRFAQMIRGGGARDPPRARIYAELAGCGVSSDAQHLTEPDPSGQSQVCAMRMAFADGGISPDEIDYISWTGRTELRRGGLRATGPLAGPDKVGDRIDHEPRSHSNRRPPGCVERRNAPRAPIPRLITLVAWRWSMRCNASRLEMLC